MADGNPSFTMIVCTYKRRQMVCETVEAIGRIRYAGDFELVVIIDGSQDGTREALEAIELPFPYRVVWQENAGLGAARNRGAAEARHEILFFLDDDMVVTPELVEEHARCYREGADAVLGDIPLDGASPPGFLTDGIAIWSAASARETTMLEKLRPFHVFGGQLSVRRSAFEAAGGFDTSFTANGNYGQEDADFGVRLLERFDVRFNPNAVSYHRYIVTPRENIGRAFKSGRSDMKFIRRHPSLSRELFEFHKIDKRTTRWVLKPLGRVPLLSRILAGAAWRLAALALATRHRYNPTVARIYYAAQQIAYWSAINRNGGYPDATSARVLCYHAIADHADDPTLATYSIAPQRFAQQIDSLLAGGYTFVTARDYLACRKGIITLPRRSLLLTFDDCYADLLDAARTVLKPRGIPALAFAVTAMPSGTNEWDQANGVRPLQLLDAAGLRELQALGIEIGAHSRTHRMMMGLPDSALKSETRGAADDLEAMGLPRPRFFAYPHGGRDRRSIAAVADAGYEAAFSLAFKDARERRNLFDVSRIQILGTDAPWRFHAKTRWPRLTFLAARIAAPLRRLGT